MSRAHNARWREWLADEIGALSNHGLRVVPSKTNFLLILFDGKLTAEAAMKGLWEAGYATRWLPGQDLPNGLRITIGTEAQVRVVADTLRAMANWPDAMLPFARITIIGLGLIGSSLARAIRAEMPTARVTGHDADPAVRETARRIDLCDDITDTAGASVTDADLVVLCVPVRATGAAAADLADDPPADAIISDVGSCKADVLAQLVAALPGRTIIPAHPVAGTEQWHRKRVSPPCSRGAGASSPRPLTLTPWRSSASPNCGGGSARTSRRWTPRIMIWCWR